MNLFLNSILHEVQIHAEKQLPPSAGPFVNSDASLALSHYRRYTLFFSPYQQLLPGRDTSDIHRGDNLHERTMLKDRNTHHAASQSTAMGDSEDSGSRGGHGIYDMLDYFWETPDPSEKCSSADLVILGKTYTISLQTEHDLESQSLKEPIPGAPGPTLDKNSVEFQGLRPSADENRNTANRESDSPFNNIKAFLNKFSGNTSETGSLELGKRSLLPSGCPQAFWEDLYTRLWFTYRAGFPIIERDKNGPSPLSIGSILRGTLDVNNLGRGFTTDSGWGCMIRTSQSLLANALIALKLGREWQLDNSSSEDLEIHWEIVEQFADVPEAIYSIQNYVLYAAKYCGKRPGEWFGPSNAAKSIQKLCEEKNTISNLKVYISTDSGDIFEDEVLDLSQGSDGQGIFTPLLILCGVRLGVQNINPVYWDFLKYLLQLPHNVGISGGRPSSSHYFFGYQSDHLFYLDPHVPQSAILLDESGHINEKARMRILSTIHSRKLRRLHLGKIDPSMLIGFLIKTREEYDAFKEKINSFDCTRKFISVHDSRPQIASLSSAGSELDGFIDLGVESINEEEEFDNEKEKVAKPDHEAWKEEIENAGPTSRKGEERYKAAETLGAAANIKEEALVNVDNNFTVDAFDLDCDPSQEINRSNIQNGTSATGEESLVVVSDNDPIDLVVVENPDVEEH